MCPQPVIWLLKVSLACYSVIYCDSCVPLVYCFNKEFRKKTSQLLLKTLCSSYYCHKQKYEAVIKWKHFPTIKLMPRFIVFLNPYIIVVLVSCLSNCVWIQCEILLCKGTFSSLRTCKEQWTPNIRGFCKYFMRVQNLI